MKYKIKVTEVDAVFWDGTNRQEVIDFLKPYLARYGDWQESGPYFGADECPSCDSPNCQDCNYANNMVQFYWGDDIEVDEKSWIVFSVSPESDPSEPEFDVTVDSDELFRIHHEVPQ